MISVDATQWARPARLAGNELTRLEGQPPSRVKQNTLISVYSKGFPSIVRDMFYSKGSPSIEHPPCLSERGKAGAMCQAPLLSVGRGPACLIVNNYVIRPL